MTTAATRGPRVGVGNLPILVKIIIVALVAALGGGAAAVVGLTKLSATAAATERLYRENLLPATQLGDIETDVIKARMALMNLVVAGTDEARGNAKKSMTDASSAIDGLTKEYATYAADRSALEEMTGTWKEYVAYRDATLVPLAEQGKLPEFMAARAKGADPIIATLMAALDTATKAEAAQAKARVEQAQSAYRSSLILVIVILVVGIVTAMVAAWLIARQIRGALVRTAAVAQALARNDLTVRSGVGTRDEIGRMAGDLDGAVTALQDVVRSVTATADAVAASSEELSATTSQIASAAADSSEKASQMAAASSEVTASVANVAGAAEQMSASIREIADNASQAAMTASSAATEAESIQGTVRSLGESSQEIGKVIALINAIAEQTNLLALNATIEAARAGEAGKGFAVVAGEVKELAQQTASATSDISARVEAIQTETQRAVTAIDQITGTVATISSLQTTIAGAVEEQTATTAEISRSVQEAAGGSERVSSDVQAVSEAADSTRTGVGEAQQATNELARMAAQLRELTGQFHV